MENNILIDISDLLSLMLAGNFTFTAKSLTTGEYYTYQVVKDKENEVINLHTWDIYPDVGKLILRDDKIEYDIMAHNINELSVKVFTVIFNFMKEDKHHPKLELYRSIKCARCGRKLTTPESIEKGIGPECEKENLILMNQLDLIQQQNKK